MLERMESVRTTLLAKKAELEDQMAQLEAPTGDRGEISFGKRIGEGTSLAVDRLSQVAVHDKLQLTKADVERALAKVEDGTYGTCDVCGRPIGEGRLRGPAVGHALRGRLRAAVTDRRTPVTDSSRACAAS